MFQHLQFPLKANSNIHDFTFAYIVLMKGLSEILQNNLLTNIYNWVLFIIRKKNELLIL